MTDTNAQEPTMEEILASIRRIISEDDAPAAEATPAAAEPETVEPEAEPEAAEPSPESSDASPALMDTTPSMQEAQPAEDEEIFDLTDRYEAPNTESIGDLDVHAPAEASEPEPFPTAFAAPEFETVTHEPAPSASSVDHEALVGETTSASAASAFAGLAASFRQSEPTPSSGTGQTIDDLASALLKPMLKEWLDANLSGIVQAAVKKEVERISRSV